MSENYHGPPPPALPRRLATALRIGADFVHSCLRPLVARVDVGEAPSPMLRAGTGGRWPGDSLRLLIWNIHRGYGGPMLASELGRLMQRLDPDVLLLQEVPLFERVPFWELPAVAPLLADYHLAFVPMHRVAPPTPSHPFAANGLLTASRWAPAGWQTFALPQVSRPKLGPRHRVRRVGLRLHLQGDEGAVVLYNVHLENTAPQRGRAAQAAAVTERVAELERADSPVLLAGDWNAFWGRSEGLYGVLEGAGFERCLPARTRWGLPQIDHLFHRGIRRARVRRLAVAGSDHSPLAGWVHF
jgi:endonuclease/exonuclease/phosphatase family metal-dependent hydrolase